MPQTLEEFNAANRTPEADPLAQFVAENGGTVPAAEAPTAQPAAAPVDLEAFVAQYRAEKGGPAVDPLAAFNEQVRTEQRIAQERERQLATLPDRPGALGAVGDVAASVGAGATVDLQELFWKAMRPLYMEGFDGKNFADRMLDQVRANKENWDWTKQSRQTVESAADGVDLTDRATWTGAARSAGTALPIMATGAALGAAAAGTAGTAAGLSSTAAAGGGFALSSSMFGSAAYQDFLEQAAAQGLDPKDAEIRAAALKNAIAQGATEGAANLLDMAFGGVAGKAFRGIGGNTIKNMLKAAGALAGSAISEGATEAAQGATEAAFKQSVGMETVSPGEAAVQQGKLGLAAGLLMGGAGALAGVGGSKPAGQPGAPVTETGLTVQPQPGPAGAGEATAGAAGAPAQAAREVIDPEWLREVAIRAGVPGPVLASFPGALRQAAEELTLAGVRPVRGIPGRAPLQIAGPMSLEDFNAQNRAGATDQRKEGGSDGEAQGRPVQVTGTAGGTTPPAAPSPSEQTATTPEQAAAQPLPENMSPEEIAAEWQRRVRRTSDDVIIRRGMKVVGTVNGKRVVGTVEGMVRNNAMTRVKQKNGQVLTIRDSDLKRFDDETDNATKRFAIAEIDPELAERVQRRGPEELGNIIAVLREGEMRVQQGMFGKKNVISQNNDLYDQASREEIENGWINFGMAYPKGLNGDSRQIIEDVMAGKKVTRKQMEHVQAALDYLDSREDYGVRPTTAELMRVRPAVADAIIEGKRRMDGREPVTMVQHDQLEPGDIVREIYSDELMRVEEQDGKKVLKDGEIIDITGERTIETAGVIKKGNPAHGKAVEAFKRQEGEPTQLQPQQDVELDAKSLEEHRAAQEREAVAYSTASGPMRGTEYASDTIYDGRNPTLGEAEARARADFGDPTLELAEVDRADAVQHLGIEQEALDRYEQTFGRRVVFFAQRGGRVPLRGINSGRDTRTVMLNVANGDAFMEVAGHELMEGLRAEDPKLYGAFKDQVRKLLKGVEAYQRERGRAEGRNIDATTAETELINDLAGQAFDRPEFWRQLAKREPTTFERVAEAGLRILRRIAETLGLGNRNVRRVDAFRDALLATLEQHMKTGPQPSTTGAQSYSVKPRRFAERVWDDIRFSRWARAMRNNPENYYQPQDYGNIRTRLATMSDVQLAAEMGKASTGMPIDSADNISVLAGLELMQRQTAAGQDPGATSEALAKMGTTVGQLLRQFRELKTKNPDGLLGLILKKMEATGLTLNSTQRVEMRTLIAQDFAAKDALERALTNHKTTYNQASAARVEAARKASEEAWRNVANYLRDVAPRGEGSVNAQFWRMMTTAMQGGLLALKSQVANVVGNGVFLPVMTTAKSIAATADAVLSLATGSQRAILQPAGDARAFAAGAKEGARDAVDTLKYGRKVEFVKGELVEGFAPLRSLAQALTGRNLPIDMTTGKPSARARFLRAAEFILGWHSEPMLRALELGDSPIRQGVYKATLAEQGRLRGLKGDALRKFLDFPEAQAAKVATKESKAMVFQQDNIAANTATGAFKAIERIPAVGPVLNFLTRGVFPYVKTPTNVIWESLQFLEPTISLSMGAWHGINGNRREALMSFGKAATGAMMLGAAHALLKAGLITGDADKEKRNVRALQMASDQSPNTLNLSGLNRLLRGENPAKQAGDTIVNYQRFGIFGFAMAYIASTKGKTTAPSAVKLAEGEATGMFEGAPYLLSATMNQTFMQGASELLQSVDRGNFDEWFKSTFNATSAAVLPRQIEEINRTMRETIPDLRTDTVADGFKNTIRLRLGFGLEAIPARRDLLGRPIATAQPGSLPAGRLYDLGAIKTAQADKVVDELAKVYQATGDSSVIPSGIDNEVRIKNQVVELTRAQQNQLEGIVGAERLRQLTQLISDPNYRIQKPETKAKAMRRINERARDAGLRKFATQNNM